MASLRICSKTNPETGWPCNVGFFDADTHRRHDQIVHSPDHLTQLPGSAAAASPAIPPTLPPSVEDAYRRKCIQLKQRLNEVEESNDTARARLSRLQRGIEKMRLERAFLLEQLAKRTSTNVEDSEGSPSPPPSVSPVGSPSGIGL
jgi:hypothetical protein